ncbi:MAG: 50S ribosomal protein L2 [Candidatus Woesearchaeota archaeon]
MGKSLIQQARGKGGPAYRALSFRYKSDSKLRAPTEKLLQGTITDFVHCPGHSAPLAEIEYEDGETCLLIAPEGAKIGDKVFIGAGAEIAPGNVLSLKDIPEGTPVYNIELQPGDGGRFCRSSGVFARIVAKTANYVTLLLPSKKLKNLHADCRAIVGIVSGGGRVEKPFLKAGTKHHKARARNKRYPRQSAAAQNAVDHPFGNKRTSRKAKQRAVGHFAPPGRKVGKFWPKRTGRRK